VVLKVCPEMRIALSGLSKAMFRNLAANTMVSTIAALLTAVPRAVGKKGMAKA